MTNVQVNTSLSVDCVIFGFDGVDLRVLLVKRKSFDEFYGEGELKLPGMMILENETLSEAASRVLEISTGLRGIDLKQTTVFSDPNRVTESELEWICRYHCIQTERVVTVGYYALIRLSQGLIEYTAKNGAIWQRVDEIRGLAMDHFDILSDGLDHLKMDILNTSIAFSLLPKKFTVRQLQRLLEVTLGIEMDNRNFRKKLFVSGILIETGEFEKHVNHKPAQMYRINKAVLKSKLTLGKGSLIFRWL